MGTVDYLAEVKRTSFMAEYGKQFGEAMEREYNDSKEGVLEEAGQEHYRVDRALVSVTMWNSRKAEKLSIPEGHARVDIETEDNVGETCMQIQEKTGHLLVKILDE
jgi:hypothetical protein